MKDSLEKVVISAAEAARMLCTTPNKVLVMLERGEIPAYREGRNWKIPKRLLIMAVEERAIREAEERKRRYSHVD